MKRLVIALSIIALVGIGVFLFVQWNLNKPIDVTQLVSTDIISTPVYRTYITPSPKEEWGRSPFLPQASQRFASVQKKGSASNSIYLGKPYEGLTLNGVFIRGTTRIAIVNNRPLKIGDQINGLTVVDIQKNSVKFDNGTTLKTQIGGEK